MAHTAIPLFTGTVPNRTQSANDFADNADDWLAYQAPLAADYNALATVIDAQATAADVSASAASVSEIAAEASAVESATSATTSQSNANFKGRWSDATGAATVPASYSNNGQTWQLLQNIADITADEPVAGASNWQVINDVNMANVRLSKLNNPITHLFKKNNFVEVLRGNLSVTRSTIATYVDRYEIVRTALPDIPREEKEGWLIEGAGTNLALRSEEFDDAAWTKTGTTISADSTSAPDLTVTADTMTEDNSTGLHRVFQAISGLTIGIATTYSFYVKANGRTKFRGVLTALGGADFDLVAKIAVVFSGATNGRITELANGWFRCSFTFVSTLTSHTWQILLLDAAGLDSYTGDGVSSGFFWGTQAEELPFASSYIATTTVSVTRAADNISVEVLDNFLSSAEGDHTQSFKYTLLGDTGGNVFLYSTLSEGASGSKFTAFSTTAGAIRYIDGGVVGTNSPSNTFTVEHDIALVTKDGKITAYSDSVAGTEVTIVPDGDPLDISSTLHFGRDLAGGIPMYGHLSDYKIHDFGFNLDEIKLQSGI